MARDCVTVEVDIVNSTDTANLYPKEYLESYSKFREWASAFARVYPALEGKWANDCGRYVADPAYSIDALIYATQVILSLPLYNLRPTLNTIQSYHLTVRAGVDFGPIQGTPNSDQEYEVVFANAGKISKQHDPCEIGIFQRVMEHLPSHIKRWIRPSTQWKGNYLLRPLEFFPKDLLK